MLTIVQTGSVAIRVLVVAAVLMFAILAFLAIRKPFVRQSIRTAAPAATEAQIEQRVRSSQRRTGIVLWLVIFGIPMVAVELILIANNMSIR